MTKPNMRGKRAHYLNGEILFKYYWATMGTARSISGVIRYCKAQGIVNPMTGLPPSQMGVEKAMWRWAVLKENFEEGYEIVNAAMRDQGQFMSKEEWRDFLFHKIGIAYQYTPRYYKRFLKRNGYEIQPPNPS